MGESYYIIEKDLEPRVTGIRLGVDQGKIDKQTFANKSWLNDFLYGGGDAGLRRGEFPDKDFILDEVWLDKKAKLNDFMSVGALSTGFIVSSKVVDILNTCLLPPHKFYPVTFNQAGTIVGGYYWFYYNLFDGKQYVNFEKSIFDTEEEEKTFNESFTISNYVDFMNLTLRMNRGVHPTKIVFDKTFNKNLDFFGMHFLGSESYISNRLKKKFEENKIKGFKLREPADPILEWE